MSVSQSPSAVRPLLLVCFIGTAGCSYDYGALGGHGAAGGAAVIGSGGSAGSAQVGASGGATHATTGGTNGSGGGALIAAGGARAPSGSGGASTGSGGITAASGGAAGQLGGAMGPATDGGGDDPDLVLWYPFDEAAGQLAGDRSALPGGPRNATVTVLGSVGSARFTPDHRVGTHALELVGDGSAGGGYVTLPSLVDLAPGAVTLAVWVYPRSSATWQRVFDFGNDKRSTYMFLTVVNGADTNRAVRFDITQGGNNNDQVLDSTVTLTQNAWHHLVVVLTAGTPYTGTIYVDGAPAGSNATMTLHPSDLGLTAHNYIGRSQYETDSYLTGSIDDLRIYRRALTADEVAALFALR